MRVETLKSYMCVHLMCVCVCVCVCVFVIYICIHIYIYVYICDYMRRAEALQSYMYVHV
jgi:hypothetical protein